MRDLKEKKSHKKPNLEQEITLFCTEPKAERPKIRITAERYRIEKNRQVLSYYRIYTNENLFSGTYNLDKVAHLLHEARKSVRFQRMEDQQISDRCNSMRRIKFSAQEII